MSVRRAVTVSREQGVRELFSRSRHAIRHRLIRRHVIPNVPFPTVTFMHYLRLRHRLLDERYVSGDPFELRYIDPDTITHVSKKSLFLGQYHPIHWGRIEGGDWDRSTVRFDSLPVPHAIHLHYEHDVPWEETPLREGFERRLAGSAESWDYSREEFERRVTDVENLVDSIRTHGYRSKRELRNCGPIETADAIPPILDEVTVDIGRNNRPLFRFFGVHRLAIAKLLNIEAIPVLVGTWHEAAVDER